MSDLGQHVVHPDSRSHVGAFPDAVLDWIYERDRPDEVWGDRLAEQCALAQCLSHEFDVELLQVAEAAVDEFGGAARCSGRKVPLFDESDGQSSRDSIEGTPNSGDTTADDDDIESSTVEFLKGF